MLDFNDADAQRSDLLPDGIFCPLKLTIRSGGDTKPGFEYDGTLFKNSLRPGSDVVMLDCELSVLPPSPHAGRKFWQLMTIAGGRVGEDGTSIGWNITKAQIRAMIDSALGIDPADMSDAAKAKRSLKGFRDLDGLEFIAKIGIDRGGPAPDGGTYKDKNVIAHVVEPNEPQWAQVRAGKIPPPAPSSRPAAAAAAPVQAKPAWQQETPATVASAPAEAKPATTPQGPAWLRGEK
jgi:hypothetical protein